MAALVAEDRIKIALIPSFEPDDKLPKLVKKLKERNYKVIIVNDGSDKKYQKYFEKCNTKIIKYPQNRGKGFALKTGLKYIKNNYRKYIIVTMDSDGQHAPEDADKLVDFVKENPQYLVLGSRKRDKNTPLRSYLGNTITKGVYKLVTNIDIYDTQTGLRAFTEELITYMLEEKGDRYEYEMNVLLNTKKNHIKIKEIEIKTIYIDNNKNSHFNTLKDSFKIYREIIKYSLSSIASFLIDYVLYLVFNLTTNNLIFSNVISRIISGTINYNINKKIVFKSEKNATLKYLILALTILILNTIILSVLSHFINKYIAKIITEIILFFLSYIIQKKLIFKGDD